MLKIVKNAIQCNHCGDVIESTPQRNFVTCSCGCCSVEGGHAYLRREWKYSLDDFTDLTQVLEVDDDNTKKTTK